MNERINQLNREAQAYATRIVGEDEINFNIWMETFEWKLAKLIVLECAKVAKKVDGDESDDYKSGRTWAGVDILKHFGVE